MKKFKRVILSILCVMLIGMSVNANTFTMRATWYKPGHGCGWVVAAGKRIDYNKLKKFQIRWVALSPEMFRKHGFKFGDVIVVESDEYEELCGEWTVMDKSGESGKHIDFLFAQKPKKFGAGKVKIRKKKKQDDMTVNDSIDLKVKKAFNLV